MKVLVALLLPMLGSMAFADQNCMGKACKETPAPAKPPEQKENKLKKPIQLYATKDNDGINLGVRADLLYMNYTSPIYTYVAEVSIASANYDSHIFPSKGIASLGCDLALTYTMHDDPGYSFESSWFHIVTEFNNSVTGTNILPVHILAANTPAPGTATHHGHMAINFWDLVMSKDFRFGNPFTLSPMAGVIGGYMDSHNVSSFNATSGTFSTTTGFGTGTSYGITAMSLTKYIDFKGIGVKLGTGYKFDLWKWVKLTGDITYNALYGFTTSRMFENQNGTYAVGAGTIPLNSSTARYTNHHGMSFVDSLIALAWQQTFCKDKLYFDLHVGWRFQSYLDGWAQFEAELNDSEHTLNLFGQGLDVGLAIKF